LRIVVTRPRDQATELAKRIQELGHEVIVEPLIRIEPIGPETIAADGYDWLVVTSPNGARELARRLRGRPRRIAAIGSGTAAALREHRLEPDLVPETATQEGLLAELPAARGRVLFAGAEDARTVLPAALNADVVHLYRTVGLRPAAFPDGDLVVLASASAARAYAALGRDIPAVSIGPATSRAARESGITMVTQAASHDLEGLVEAIRQAAE
jgi:uroporphyrinogen-III synthase